MGGSQYDPEEILEALRASHRALPWEPLAPEVPRASAPSDQARSDESLRYLHAHWALPDHYDPTTGGGGVRGRIVGLLGRAVFRVLGPYLRSEREVLSHLVRVNDALEKRCDELTERCAVLSQDMVNRQVAEARNQAELAVWLHATVASSDQPASGATTTSGDALR